MSSNENNPGQQKIKFDPSAQKKQPKTEPVVEYKTELQIKADALKRMEEQRLIAAARPPKSQAAKKADNFLYHYKWTAIACAVALIMAVVFVRDIFFQVKPDLTILTISQNYISTEERAAMSEYLSHIVSDLNGDGKTVVALDVVRLPANAIAEEYRLRPLEVIDEFQTQLNVDTEADMAGVMKIMAIFAAQSDAVIMLDKASYDYLLRSMAEKDAEGNLLEPVDILKIYEETGFTLLEEFDGSTPYALDVGATNIPAEIKNMVFNDMGFYLRYWPETKKNAGIIEEGYEFLEHLAAITN